MSKMVFGHNLHHMAPFGILEAGFYIVCRRASFRFGPMDHFWIPESQIGPKFEPGPQCWSPGSKNKKMRAEKPCKTPPPEFQMVQVMAKKHLWPGPTLGPIWGAGPRFPQCLDLRSGLRRRSKSIHFSGRAQTLVLVTLGPDLKVVPVPRLYPILGTSPNMGPILGLGPKKHPILSPGPKKGPGGNLGGFPPVYPLLTLCVPCRAV